MGVKKIVSADCVFQGKIVSKRVVVMSGLEYYRYVFYITQPIKGVSDARSIDIYSIAGLGTCEANYAGHNEMIIFAYKRNDKYFTGKCHDNRFIDSVSEDYQKCIESFLTACSYQKWKNVDDELDAEGKVCTWQAEGRWVFYHADGSIESEGTYEHNLKICDWKFYLNKRQSTEYLRRHEYTKELGSPNNILSKTTEYDNGEIIHTQRISKAF
jgi:hypothetical protein